jgi:hypothetical protein
VDPVPDPLLFCTIIQIIHRLLLFKTQRFGDWILSPFSGGLETGTSSVDWVLLSRLKRAFYVTVAWKFMQVFVKLS